MLGEMAWESEYFLNASHKVLCDLPRTSDALLLKTAGQLAFPVPPGQRVCELINKVAVESHRLADIAYGATRSVGDDGCS